jgi:hypothetical protein
MDDSRPDEIERALDQFRVALIREFVDIHVRLAAIEQALACGQQIDASRLKALQEEVREVSYKFRDRLAERIPSGYDVR